jgi:hypothetical protein
MGDLLIKLLFLLLELVFEALFELALGAIFDLLVRAFAAFFETVEIKNSVLAFAGYSFFGRRTLYFALPVFTESACYLARFSQAWVCSSWVYCWGKSQNRSAN